MTFDHKHIISKMHQDHQDHLDAHSLIVSPDMYKWYTKVVNDHYRQIKLDELSKTSLGRLLYSIDHVTIPYAKDKDKA